jgi:SAM-dependent methyltransferase
MDIRIYFDYLLRKLFLKPKDFKNSEDYWLKRYRIGGNSGAGSYNELARNKARILNSLIHELEITSIIEHGCGDGEQLKLIQVESYIGLDISPEAIRLCKRKFKGDKSKAFFLYEDFVRDEKAEASVSLDVIFHLVEDEVFETYMSRLFRSARRYVIIYSSNTNEQYDNKAKHVRHRKFTDWIMKEQPDFNCVRKIITSGSNPGSSVNNTFCDFYVYQKRLD